MSVDGQKFKFGVAIYDNPDLDLSEMEKSLKSVLDCRDNSGVDARVIMLYKHGDRPISETLHLSNYYTSEKGMPCRGCNTRTDDLVEMETDLFGQLIFADYFIRMDAGQEIDENFFSEVSGDYYSCCDIHAINVELAKDNYLKYCDYKAMEEQLTK